MRSLLFSGVVAGAIMAAAPLQPASAYSICPGQTHEGRLECKVYKLLNKHRIANGRRALKGARLCHRMARAHARTMRKHRDLSHEVIRGQDPNVRANKYGLGKARNAANRSSPYRYSGENLARYHATAEDVMRGWRWSIWGHNATMLRPEHTHVGVGLAIARDKQGKPIKGQYWWAQVFCNRRR